MSVPASRVVCGYEIRKMPLGAYLQAIELLRNLPGDFLATCFPGSDLNALVASVSGGSPDAIQAVLSTLVGTAPGVVLQVLSRLTGIDQERLENDEAIGLDGLIEIINAWVEINGLANFMGGVRALAENIKTAVASSQKPKTGFKGSSRMA